MAENLLRADCPTHKESLNFAKALYCHIWRKFKVVQGVDDPFAKREPRHYSDHFHLDIAKAVLSEQIITRSFYKYLLFDYKKAFVLKDQATALIFCKMICKQADDWDYFKQLFRCSALIAEFFLYRIRSTTTMEVVRAPLIWNAVFKKYFAETFNAHRGWEGLLEYSLNYEEVYPPMEILIEDMKRPYDDISESYEDCMPFDILIPVTNPETVKEEMIEVFDHMKPYFAGRKKPKTPVAKTFPVIPEDCESDSTDSSSSERDPPSFKSDILNRLLLDDVKKKTTKGSRSKLDQPSCSTSMDIPEDEYLSDEQSMEEDYSEELSIIEEDISEEQSMEEDSGGKEQSKEEASLEEQSKEEGSVEEQSNEEGSDESLPKFESEGKDSKKKSPPMDYSGSKDPTQTK